MVITTLNIEDVDYNYIKSFCKEQGFTLKGLLLNGAKRIIEESRKNGNNRRL